MNNLSQATFGKKIGVSRDVINNIENNRVELSELMLKAVCAEFGINEEWLRTGQGEMNIDFSNDEAFGKAMDEIFKDEDPFIRNMIIEMASLPKEEKEAMKKAFSILKKITSK